MAVDREALVVAGVAGAAILGAVVISRSGGAREPLIAVTGPSPETARETVRASTEIARIESQRETGLAGIYSNALVRLTETESRERISFGEQATRERIRTGELTTQTQLARLASETAKFQISTAAGVEQARIGAQQQKSFFDTILSAVRIFVPFL